MLVLSGSRAIKFHFPDFPREPHDTDWITEDHKGHYRKGSHVAEFLPNPVICRLFNPMTRDVKILSPDMLYTLKVSHAFWDIGWSKHMFDIEWLQDRGCKLDEKLLWKLYEFWCKMRGSPKRPNLKMSKEEFFTNGIKNGQNHDNIHPLIKDPPTYTKILIGEVEISEEKFFTELTHEERLDIVREEVICMAYERLAGRSYRIAYSEQLKSWILHHAPTTKMALFAVQNYKELRKPLFDYVKHIDNELKRNNC